jgi:[acyl-carrier-protein] S-malonyltransferase
MKKVALLFAGQGAQYANMGLQTIAETPLLQPYAETIQSSLSFSLSTILASTDGSLNLTKYTQPSVLATSLLLYRQLQTLFPITFDYVAGFSLGEFTALHIAGYLSLPSVLSLITLRAETMDAIANKRPGAMAAVIGGSLNDVENLVKSIDSIDSPLSIANYNCPGQVVISGSVEAIDQAIAVALQFNIRRAIKLNVSGAFHTPFMKDASLPIASFLEKNPFLNPSIPMLFNVTGNLVHPKDVKTSVISQVYSPVYFQKTIENLIALGVNTFIEIGPGNVLTGFVKKINTDVVVFTYNGINDMSPIKEYLHE